MRLRSGKIINEPSVYNSNSIPSKSIPNATPKHIINIPTAQQTQPHTQPLSNIDAAHILLHMSKQSHTNIHAVPPRPPLRTVYGEVTNYIYSMYKNKQ